MATTATANNIQLDGSGTTVTENVSIWPMNDVVVPGFEARTPTYRSGEASSQGNETNGDEPLLDGVVKFCQDNHHWPAFLAKVSSTSSPALKALKSLRNGRMSPAP